MNQECNQSPSGKRSWRSSPSDHQREMLATCGKTFQWSPRVIFVSLGKFAHGTLGIWDKDCGSFPHNHRRVQFSEISGSFLLPIGLLTRLYRLIFKNSPFPNTRLRLFNYQMAFFFHYFSCSRE
ncbi:hypothetical protein AVEN_89572-1 [Araneus ventricosus]|uniref:Uncharacterized protein n=1 Tax=Araneus ventricosus TaxID=182803 RepID=A0A4Y2W1S8_ARAVE|nr:hypothetical protein AVEN_275401-1 [Araneus ventricosus]GBO30821.1 hypothetical protein AVEN_89572-1 [Araneus ventricosus]